MTAGVAKLPSSPRRHYGQQDDAPVRAELANAIRARYRSATGGQKRKILDEFIAVTGYHEKSAIRALNTEPIAKGRQSRTRVSLYDETARAALIVLWEASDRVRRKRLRVNETNRLPPLRYALAIAFGF